MFTSQHYTQVGTALPATLNPGYGPQRLFPSELGNEPWASSYGAANVYETADTVIVEMAVPGFKAADISVYEQQGVLTICANRRAERRGEHDDISFDLQRIHFVQRNLRLPCDVDTDAAKATLSDGLLTIRLPKARTSHVRRIVIQPSKQSITVQQNNGNWLARLANWWSRQRARLTNKIA